MHYGCMLIISCAICNYFLNLGLSGSNLLENTEVFSIVGATEDAWVNIFNARYKQPDQETTVTAL